MSDINGSELPENRKAAVEAGLAQYNMIAHERDELQREVRELRTQIASYRAGEEASDARILEMENRISKLTLERDQAVGDRAVYETLFISIQAQLRAFAVPSAPLVKDMSEESNDAFTAMRNAYDVRLGYPGAHRSS